MKPQTRHITATFRQASAEDRDEARAWYQRARELAEDLAERYEPRDFFQDGEDVWVPGAVERAAAVIAVLSPRLSWPKNVELARWAYQAHFGGMSPSEALAHWPGIKANAAKAFRILGGEDPDAVVGGPKVRAFWLTIVDPTDPRTVVIDRHAFDVAVNQPLTDQVRGVLLGRKGAYDSISTLYRRAAAIISRELGEAWTPAEIQAVTWTYWRRERAAAFHKGA